MASNIISEKNKKIQDSHGSKSVGIPSEYFEIMGINPDIERVRVGLAQGKYGYFIVIMKKIIEDKLEDSENGREGPKA